MRTFWQKRIDSMDEQDAYDYIKKSFRDADDEHYARGGSSSGGRGTSSSYHADPNSKLKELAEIYEKIQDFFQSIGVDYRNYLPMHQSKH